MNIRRTIANLFDPPHKNALGSGDGLAAARDFMRHGPRQTLYPDWHQVLMSERDKYTGYMYGASTRRANKVAMLATYNLRTTANQKLADEAAKKGETLKHPYLGLIDAAPSFENDLFWRALQTWIDIKGVAYILAVRGKLQDTVGPVKYFELLWPSEMAVMRDASNLEILGYTQSIGGMIRDIPPHQVITIRDFNPMSRTELFSMADAANDSQFTLKESAEHMRMTSRRNRTYPGVAYIQGDNVALDQEGIANFKGRLRQNASSGEPVFAKASAGKGSLDWNDMQIDLRKSAIDMVSEVNLNEFMAVSGMSKTKLNIEQSGVTRDSSQTQEDLFIADHAMPALQKIIDALNEDYKHTYRSEYEKTGYTIEIVSPLGDDKEADGLDIKNRSSRFELYTDMREKGYDHDTAAAYASGEKSLDEIGDPKDDTTAKDAKNEVSTEDEAKTLGVRADAVGTLVRSGFDPSDSANLAGIEGVKHLGYLPVTVKTEDPPAATATPANSLPSDAQTTVFNLIPPSENATVKTAKDGLKRASKMISLRLLEDAIRHVRTQKNALVFSDESDVVDKAAAEVAAAALEKELITYYRILIPLAGWETISERSRQFGLIGRFKMDNEVNEYIDLTAAKASVSHVETVIEDIVKTVQETEERLVQGEVKKITPKPGQTPEDILKEARRLALDGNGREKIISELKKTYADKIAESRAEVIAISETNRAYNRAQFEADRQFLTENKLMKKAYKQWVTRSDAPCSYCLAKAKEPPIPFTQAFAKEGDTLTATFEKKDGSMSVRSMKVGFEDSMAGEVHARGQCTYVLVFKDDKGKVI